MSRRDHLAQLRTASPVILPSLLLCDFGNLAQELTRLHEAGVVGLHLDVMDGNFVPNLTYGMPIVEGLRRHTNLPLDVHLMIQRPERYLEAFATAGADILTIHAEAVAEPRSVLEKIRSLGLGAGLAVNPNTPIDVLETCVDVCDLFLVMSVQAGFGGQAFNPLALEKLRAARALGGDRLLLEVDGGINLTTIADCAAAGAQLFVAGSSIFKQPDYGLAVQRLREQALSRAEVA
jgi:ribulose-phosphate 3-epimerase